VYTELDGAGPDIDIGSTIIANDEENLFVDLTVNGSAADDTVSVKLDGTRAPGMHANFDIDLGEGDNLLMLDGKGNDINVEVQGGSGADEVIVHAKPVPASPAGVTPGKLTANIDLAGGNDKVEIKALGDDSRVDSFFDIFCDVDLGEGDNLLMLDGKGNDINVEVQGGSGVDFVSMAVDALNTVNSTVAVGSGSDVIRGKYSMVGSVGDALRLATAAETTNTSSVRVVAGAGDDQVVLQLAGLLDQPMHIGVLGQCGSDELRIETGQLEIHRGGALSVGINGGQDDDKITFVGLVAGDAVVPTHVGGRVQLRLAGDQGNDTIKVSLPPRTVDSSYFSVKVFGGVGDDLLTLLAEDVAGRFLIDGGPGDDDYLASKNVLVRKCEGLLDDIESIAKSSKHAVLQTE